jgi:hypothetical protein
MADRLHGVDLRPAPDGGWTGYRDGRPVGAAFPKRPSSPGGVWFGRRIGEAARRCDSPLQALRHLVGCAANPCPECEEWTCRH